MKRYLMKHFFFLTILASLVACGGVSDSSVVSDLSIDETKEVCQDMAADLPETVECSGQTVPVGPGDEANCEDVEVAPAACTATVGEYKACIKALYTDCAFLKVLEVGLPAECTSLPQDCFPKAD